MQFGVNLFGVAQIFRKDPNDFLKRIKAMGYSQVEPCITLVELPEAYKSLFWTVSEVDDFYKIIKAHKLQIVSCHVIVGDFSKDTMKLEQLVSKYGIKQFVVGCPNEGSLETYTNFVSGISYIAEKLEKFGTEVLVHNSYQELLTQIDDKSAFEWVLSQCSEKIGVQVDVGWLLFAGINPMEFLKKYASMVKSIHYKDIYEIYGNVNPTECNVCLGQGKLDVFSIFQFAKGKGIPQIIDQDASQNDFMMDLEESVNLIKSYINMRGECLSQLCILDTETCQVKQLFSVNKIIEAPNWLGEDELIYNAEGLIYSYCISSGEETVIDTDFCDNCNNDHVLSPDFKNIAISHSPKDSWMSQIYILPIDGGIPTLITEKAPSFLHGWSPDGYELAYTAFRNMKPDFFNAHIYTIPIEGGVEKQITFGEGMNDGPEYAPNGEEIWFNSTRSGLMQIWKMQRDGSNPTQMSFENRNNWFPHVSPDGSKVINIAYHEGHLEPHEHLPNMNVELWMMNYDGSDRKKLLSFFGGQGTINVNSWSKDNRHIAFVRYEVKLP